METLVIIPPVFSLDGELIDIVDFLEQLNYNDEETMEVLALPIGFSMTLASKGTPLKTLKRVS